MTVTALGTHRVKAFTGAADHCRHEVQWQYPIATGSPTTELLAGSKASIAEIAHRLGYGSVAALSRAFKRIVGVSPTHWRQGRRRDPEPVGAPLA